MPKAKWLLSAPGAPKRHPVMDGPVAVYTKADLARRLAEAKAAGVAVTVKPIED